MKKARRPRKRKGHYLRGSYISLKSGLNCKFRSGWEERYMRYLDSCLDVANWFYESMFIEYVSNKRTGKKRKYYPDFIVEYVDGKKEVVEIKPLKRVKQLAVKKKIDSAIDWCNLNGHTFRILTEIELKEIGIL